MRTASIIIYHPDDGGSSICEMLVYFNVTTRRYIPEGSDLQ
jgi:hypothetical protein